MCWHTSIVLYHCIQQKHNPYKYKHFYLIYFVYYQNVLILLKQQQQQQQHLVYISANTCTVPTVSNATADRPPNIEYNSNVTYTCQAGFSHTSGDLTRRCKVDHSLTGSTPVCSSKLHEQCWLSVISIAGKQFITSIMY